MATFGKQNKTIYFKEFMLFKNWIFTTKPSFRLPNDKIAMFAQ